MENYETFDDYLDAQSQQHQKIIREIRELVSETSPNLEESVKWGNACWVNGKLPVMFVHCKEDYVQFGFYGGAMLDDPKKLLRGKGDFVRHIPIETVDDINMDMFELLIKQASTLDYKS